MIRALITVYHPSPDAAQNVRRIAKQADIVYICDNSKTSNAALFAPLEKNVRYLFFGRNLGISRAYNLVLKHPKIPWKDDDYVIFFDQDSRIEEGHIAKMTAIHEKVRQKGYPIGCLGPVFFNTSSGQIERSVPQKFLLKDTYSVSSIITSSMLCRYGDLRQVGFWNNDIFLDLADWDLCWRMTAAGKLCCATEALVLHHALGVGEKKIGPLSLRVGHSYREYYQIREALYLLGKKYTPPQYRIRFLANLLVRTPLHLLFLDDKLERMQYVAMGILDHSRNKRGPLTK